MYYPNIIKLLLNFPNVKGPDRNPGQLTIACLKLINSNYKFFIKELIRYFSSIKNFSPKKFLQM
jgi:hypothetical protein